MSSHTPGPWSFKTVPTSIGLCHKIGPFPSNGGHGETHACIYADNIHLHDLGHSKVGDELLANAAFIVRACNSHEALVDAINHQLTAVTDFIIAVDKLMSGPPAPIRGNKLAQLITALQDDTDLLRAELAVAKGA